ncbi:hypothetical protein PSEWESI4_04029 [Pseudomonas carbonaria]|uniref:Uncharacterized protein n=1 Tax=Zestomonas carbonaria TaxID=2762745 RepID=A0A7U7ERX8_9GAMM|nr:hypothetical protein PSEWESI4_04029 [Pseudomonas carbonaria]
MDQQAPRNGNGRMIIEKAYGSHAGSSHQQGPQESPGQQTGQIQWRQSGKKTDDNSDTATTWGRYRMGAASIRHIQQALRPRVMQQSAGQPERKHTHHRE